MANRYAVANGDWSNTATWDGGTLPTSADDVYANNFNVNVNQNIDVISLRNTAGTGITAGGTFTFNTPDVTADISDTIVMNPTVTTQFILITASSGLVTINIPNGNIASTTTSNNILINHTGNCNLILSCISIRNTLSGISTIGIRAYLKTSTGLFTLNGNVFGGNSTNTNNSVIRIQSASDNIINGDIVGGSGINIGNNYGVDISSGNLTITGNLTGGTTGNAINQAVISSTNGTINITGNLTGGIASAIQSTAGTLNVTGIIEGGTSNGVVGVLIGSTGTLNHIGVAQASAFGSAIACNAPTTSTITCTGPFLRNQFIPAIASQTLRINALSNPYFEFRKSDNTDVTYVDEDTLNFPIELDVREGTSYASGLYTGTLAVPTPDNVRKGVATDDTIGTADLTAEDFFDAIATSTNDIAIRLRNVATVETTGDQIANL